MGTLRASEIATLFNEFGLHAPGSDEFKGVLTTVTIARDEYGQAVGVTANDRNAQRRGPLTSLQARGVVTELQKAGAQLPHDASFTALFSHVLMKLTRLAERKGVEMLTLSAHFSRHDYSIHSVVCVTANNEPVEKRLPKHRFSDARHIVNT